MIRWKYVLPRAVIILVALFVVWLVKDTAIRWSLIQGGESLTGAVVQIEGVKTSVSQAKIELHGIQITDPNNEDYNLFQAERGTLDLELGQVLKRKFIVEQLTIESARFNSSRHTSGQLDASNGNITGFGIGLPPITSLPACLDDIERRLLTGFTDQLETHKVAKDLAERWPRRFEELEAHLDSVQDRVNRLAAAAKQANSNPLRNFETYRQAYKDMNALQSEMQQIYRELDAVSQQVPVDRDALLAAKRHDQERIQNLALYSTMNAQEAADLLLGEDQAEVLRNVVQWVQWIRQLVPEGNETLEPKRRQGVDIRNFAGLPARPDFVIKTLDISAVGRLDDDDYRIAGIFHDISSDPVEYGHPITLDLKLDGPTRLQVQGTIDRTQSVHRDHFAISIPGLRVPARTIGSSKSIVLSTVEGPAIVRVDANLIDDEISGSISFERHHVGLDVDHVSDSLGGMETHMVLGTALQAIDDIEFRLILSGSIDAPRASLESAIGDQVSDAFNMALRQALERQSQKLSAYVEEQYDSELGQWMQLVDNQRNELSNKIRTNDAELNRLRGQLANRLGLQILR